MLSEKAKATLDAEAVKAYVKACLVYSPTVAETMGVAAVVSMMLAREAEREGPLVEALKSAYCYRGMRECGCQSCDHVRTVLAAHAARDREPEPTLVEAMEDLVALLERGHWTDPSAGAIATKTIAARAAIERERQWGAS